MRIVATSDTHYAPLEILIPDGDVFIHAGDAGITGYPDEWKGIVEMFASLPHKHKYFIPGNHDMHLKVYPGPGLQDMRRIGVEVVGLPHNPRYAKVVLPNNMKMVGLPFIVDMPNWAFSKTEDQLRNYMWEHLYWNYFRPDIIVSHFPVHGILDQSAKSGSIGSKAYLNWLESESSRGNGPKYWISGHIHESYGTTVGWNCKFYNVAMCDRSIPHKQVNPPMVIDV